MFKGKFFDHPGELAQLTEVKNYVNNHVITGTFDFEKRKFHINNRLDQHPDLTVPNALYLCRLLEKKAPIITLDVSEEDNQMQFDKITIEFYIDERLAELTPAEMQPAFAPT